MKIDAPCPVAVVPGHILVTVDNTDSVMTVFDRITREAKTSGSEVVLLGIVPEHIYSLSEKGELEKVRKETLQIMGNAAKKLKAEGITVKEITVSGYPDEEIIKVAGRYPGAIIMIPDSGDIPSELGKAAQMLLDEQDTVNLPLQVVPVSRP